MPKALKEDIAWEMQYGTTTIYGTRHLVTYRGRPEGGYVYFFREREAGWYSWHRVAGFKPPVYTKLDGQMAIWFDDDGGERIAIVPLDYEPDNGDIIIFDTDFFFELDTTEEDDVWDFFTPFAKLLELSNIQE